MNHTTRKHPRTLEEAFGPYQRGNVWEPVPEFDRADRIVMAACAVAGLAVLVLMLGGWL